MGEGGGVTAYLSVGGAQEGDGVAHLHRHRHGGHDALAHQGGLGRQSRDGFAGQRRRQELGAALVLQHHVVLRAGTEKKNQRDMATK